MAKLTGKAKAKFLARMKKGRKAAKGKKRKGRLGSASNPIRAKVISKAAKIKQLEDRLKRIEFAISMGQIPHGETLESGIKARDETITELNDELKRELDEGRNG